MFLRRGPLPRVFILALALVIAFRLSGSSRERSDSLAAASPRPSPYLGRVLGDFFDGAARFLLESSGLLDRTVKAGRRAFRERWTGLAEHAGRRLSLWASRLSRTFYEDSPLAGLKALGDRACDGILNLLGRSLTWASWGPKGPAEPPAGAAPPAGDTPSPAGAPGKGRE